MQPTMAIVAIIIAAGAVGGFAAYLVEREPKASGATAAAAGATPSLRRFAVVGIVAAACVPLFLSLVKSALFAAMEAGQTESFFIFTGLCLVASFSSRQFLDTVSRQILRQVERIDEKTDRASADARTAVELVDDQAAEPRTLEPPGAGGEAFIDAPALDERERQVLGAATKLTFRTASGIAKDTGISRLQIGEYLDSLAAKGLIGPEVSPTTGGPRWRITPKGVAAFRQSSP